MLHIGPGLGTILTASELPVAVTFSALILAELVSFSHWLGVVIILININANCPYPLPQSFNTSSTASRASSPSVPKTIKRETHF